MIVFQALSANHSQEFKSFYATDATDCGKNWGNSHAGELKTALNTGGKAKQPSQH